MTPIRRLPALLLLLWLLPAGARADEAPPKAALCAACHGAQGVPINAAVPVIWGQNEGYIYVELRDYKLGNRKNPVMGAIAATLAKPDMLALAAWFAAKPWPALNQPAPPAAIVHMAELANSAAACKGCHLDAWQGASTTPRVGGQELGYLRQTMAAFRDGARGNNPWMSALLKTYPDADIDALARYLAGM